MAMTSELEQAQHDAHPHQKRLMTGDLPRWKCLHEGKASYVYAQTLGGAAVALEAAGFAIADPRVTIELDREEWTVSPPVYGPNRRGGFGP